MGVNERLLHDRNINVHYTIKYYTSIIRPSERPPRQTPIYHFYPSIFRTNPITIKKRLLGVTKAASVFFNFKLFSTFCRQTSTRSTSAPSIRRGCKRFTSRCPLPTFLLQHWLQIGSSSSSST